MIRDLPCLKAPMFTRLVAAILTLLLASAPHAQPKDGAPLMNPPLGGAGGTAAPATKAAPPAGPVVNGFRTINWDALVPADWDPFKDFKGMNLGALDDADPRAAQMLKKMREVWDNAPVNAALVGQRVRVPGFVVPLEDTKDGMKEFLLVPYFGACIHSPPPPANQIIHILPKVPAKGLRSMDTVWISGVLTSERTDSYMGAAGYRIEAESVAPYQERGR